MCNHIEFGKAAHLQVVAAWIERAVLYQVKRAAKLQGPPCTRFSMRSHPAIPAHARKRPEGPECVRGPAASGPAPPPAAPPIPVSVGLTGVALQISMLHCSMLNINVRTHANNPAHRISKHKPYIAHSYTGKVSQKKSDWRPSTEHRA